MQASFWNGEIVLFVPKWDECKTIGSRRGFDGDTPIGSMLTNGRSDGTVVAGLDRIAARFCTSKKTIDQDSGSTALIAVYHHNRPITHRH